MPFKVLAKIKLNRVTCGRHLLSHWHSTNTSFLCPHSNSNVHVLGDSTKVALRTDSMASSMPGSRLQVPSARLSKRSFAQRENRLGQGFWSIATRRTCSKPPSSPISGIRGCKSSSSKRHRRKQVGKRSGSIQRHCLVPESC